MVAGKLLVIETTCTKTKKGKRKKVGPFFCHRDKCSCSFTHSTLPLGHCQQLLQTEGEVSDSGALLSDLPVILPLWNGRSWLPGWGILSFQHPFLLLSELCQKPSFLPDLKLVLTFLAPVAQFSFKKSIISPLLLYRRLYRKRHSWKHPNSWYLSRRLIIVCNMGLKTLLDSSGFIKMWYREGQAKCNNPFWI